MSRAGSKAAVLARCRSTIAPSSTTAGAGLVRATLLQPVKSRPLKIETHGASSVLGWAATRHKAEPSDTTAKACAILCDQSPRLAQSRLAAQKCVCDSSAVQ